MDCSRGFKSFLEVYVGNKIFSFKKRFINDPYLAFGHTDEVVLLRSLINKDSLDNDDVNDLLICFSDHVMDDNELLLFLTNNSTIYYEMDEAGFSLDIRWLIIKYLLDSNDLDIILGVFKLFSNKIMEIDVDTNFVSYNGLKVGNSLYDLYLCYESIFLEEDINLRKEKAITFMSLVDVVYFKEDLTTLEISFSDFDNLVTKYESKYLIDPRNIKRMLDNMLFLENRELSNNLLLKDVLTAYKDYSSSVINFKLNDFINYYNQEYNRDFRDFYYHNSNTGLDIELLYSILTRNNDTKDSFMIYGEFLSKFKSLGDINKEWQDSMINFVTRDLVSYTQKRALLVSYFNVIESLKGDISYTLNYYIMLNIPEEFRNSFVQLLKWYFGKEKDYFGRNIFVDSDEQKQNTFNELLRLFKEEMYDDFKNRKVIHKKYLSLIKNVISPKYITIKCWNTYLYDYTLEYYAREGLIHISEMSKLLDDGLSLVSYMRENFDIAEFRNMSIALRKFYPDMSDLVNIIYDKLSTELKMQITESRCAMDEVVIGKHSMIIQGFINSECLSKSQYLKCSGISGIRFDRALRMVKDFNHDLYVQYSDKILLGLQRGRFGETLNNGLNKH